MLVAQLRQVTVASPFVRRVRGLGAADQETVGRVGKDCNWEHPRAPAVRWLWDVRATGAVLGFLEGTRVGCRASTREARGPREGGKAGIGRGGGRAEPTLGWLYFPFFCLFLC